MFLSPLAARIFGPGWIAEDEKRLTAGASAETIAFDARDTATGVVQPLILRRTIGGRRSAESLGFADEAGIIGAARAAGVAAPLVHHLLDEADGLGGGFVMARVAGETLPHKLLRDPTFAAIRPDLARQMGAEMARIHRIAPDAVANLPDGAAQAILPSVGARIAALPAAHPVFDWALRWLEDNMPDDAPRALLHGDFRNGNLVVDPDRGIVAVLDWEIAHLGDPEEDIAWATMPPWRFGRFDHEAGGFAPLDVLIQGYEAEGGRPLDRARIRFWSVMCSLRWGLVCAEMLDWFRSGHDPSIERAMIIRRASESEMDLMDVLTDAG